jgi:hypothetical protein
VVYFQNALNFAVFEHIIVFLGGIKFLHQSFCFSFEIIDQWLAHYFLSSAFAGCDEMRHSGSSREAREQGKFLLPPPFVPFRPSKDGKVPSHRGEPSALFSPPIYMLIPF